MFNWITAKCYDCKKEFLMSIDEKQMFGYGYCHICMNPKVRHIRAKIVMGFYDIDTVNAEVVNRFIEKELQK